MAQQLEQQEEAVKPGTVDEQRMGGRLADAPRHSNQRPGQITNSGFGDTYNKNNNTTNSLSQLAGLSSAVVSNAGRQGAGGAGERGSLQDQQSKSKDDGNAASLATRQR